MNTKTQSERKVLMNEGYPIKAGKIMKIIEMTLIMVVIVRERAKTFSSKGRNYKLV